MEPWEKNLYSLWVTQFIAVAGLSMVVPFLPFYLKELGVTAREEVKVWSGLLFSAPFMVAAFLQPIWGILGDRYGRKPMIVRAMFGLALANILMGFARTAPQLLALRFFQGSLSGFVAPSLALLASSTPEEKTGGAGYAAILPRHRHDHRSPPRGIAGSFYGLPVHLILDRLFLFGGGAHHDQTIERKFHKERGQKRFRSDPKPPICFRVAPAAVHVSPADYGPIFAHVCCPFPQPLCRIS